MVRKYYSPALKAWLGDLEDGKHDGGPEDPRIGCIKVIAKTATYAINSATIIGRGVEIAKGVATGSSPKVNKLREISEEELKQCEYISSRLQRSNSGCVREEMLTGSSSISRALIKKWSNIFCSKRIYQIQRDRQKPL